MYSYIKGAVTETSSDHITVEANNIGYKIHTPNPYAFNKEKTKVFIYQHIREDENTLYGFKTEEEKELFLKLLSVKGVGPKTTLPILATGSVSGVIDAIDRENILYLKKFPKIGEKVARQIILDLKGKLVPKEESSKMKISEELVEALQALGYKTKDINRIIQNINPNDEINKQIKDALKLLLK